jgi:hypothetical protein
VLGSLLDSGWKEVFHGAAMQRVLRAQASESDPVLCRTCEVWAYEAGATS